MFFFVSGSVDVPSVMTVSLRQASNLQGSIREVLAGFDFSGSRNLSIYSDDVEGDVTRHEQTLLESVEKHRRLSAALFSIRKAVAAMNAQAGVDDLLADIAAVGSTIEVLKQVTSSDARERTELLKSRIERRRETSQTVFIQDSLQVAVVSSETLLEFEKELQLLRRRKQSLQDRLGEKNVTSKITLDPTVVATLKEFGIVE